MSSTYRSLALLGLAFLSLPLMSACGGGSGGGGAAVLPSGHNFSNGGSNVVALTVGNGPNVQQPTFNIPYTSVTICVPGSNSCVTINNVLVDTGSTGLRIMRSVLNALALTDLPDPALPANTMQECLPFADGYAWGAVALAAVRIGGESAASVPIQVIDDRPSPSPAVPAACSNNGASLDSVTAFDANGVLGVGVFLQDCGSFCATQPNNIYYSCTAAGSCTAATLGTSEQVSDPVASFGSDNNGVILQLPSIGANGAPSASGYLVFGIGTESNNALQSATILTTNSGGDFTTSLNGTMLSGFIDSGSNGLFFPDPNNSIPRCGQSGGAASFYCPSPTLQMTAQNQGANGTIKLTSFQVANLNNMGSSYAIDDVAGPAINIPGIGSSYFDWGLPFFYGNTVFVAFEQTAAGGSPGPYFAY